VEEPELIFNQIANEDKKPNRLKTKYATYYNTNRSDINASVFRDYLKTCHNVNSGINIPYTAIVMKAVANWANSKIPLSFDHESPI
jgi:hypothetical protein